MDETQKRLEKEAAERDLEMAQANFESANELMASAANWLQRAQERAERARHL